MRGGNQSLQPIPIESYGFAHGGSESEEALNVAKIAVIQQTNFNNKLAGGGRLIKGGSSTIEIPQFPQVGLSVSPQTANTAAFAINKVLINATNNASNDVLIGKPSMQLGGKYKRRKSVKRIKTKTHYKHKKICKCIRCKKTKRIRKTRKTRTRTYKKK